MKWLELKTLEDLESIFNSNDYTVIFKHSTRCPISSMTKKQFEFESTLIPQDIPVYLLDLIKHREISNKIADKWQVRHESPQVLLIKGSECVYHESHNEIEVAKVVTRITS